MKKAKFIGHEGKCPVWGLFFYFLFFKPFSFSMCRHKHNSMRELLFLCLLLQLYMLCVPMFIKNNFPYFAAIFRGVTKVSHLPSSHLIPAASIYLFCALPLGAPYSTSSVQCIHYPSLALPDLSCRFKFCPFWSHPMKISHLQLCHLQLSLPPDIIA